MRPTTTAAEATETKTAPRSISKRIHALQVVEKPAKNARIKLRHTLKENPGNYSFPGTEFVLRIPPWIEARCKALWQASILQDWVRNARYLDDPEHGEFTRARYLVRWEDAMQHRETWMERDKGATVELKLKMTDPFADNLDLIAGFLRVSHETIIIAVLASECMKRTSDDGPEWTDMVNMRAAQEHL